MLDKIIMFPLFFSSKVDLYLMLFPHRTLYYTLLQHLLVVFMVRQPDDWSLGHQAGAGHWPAPRERWAQHAHRSPAPSRLDSHRQGKPVRAHGEAGDGGVGGGHGQGEETVGEDGGGKDEEGEGGNVEGWDHGEGGGAERPVLAALGHDNQLFTTNYSCSADS